MGPKNINDFLKYYQCLLNQVLQEELGVVSLGVVCDSDRRTVLSAEQPFAQLTPAVVPPESPFVRAAELACSVDPLLHVFPAEITALEGCAEIGLVFIDGAQVVFPDHLFLPTFEVEVDLRMPAVLLKKFFI